MRKQAAAVLIVAGALGVASAPSYGGEATIDGSGNFLMLDTDLAPPVAGTRSKPQPVTLTLHQLFGNYRSGAQPPNTSGIVFRLPRGMRANTDLVGTCPLPAADADIRSNRCSTASRIGTGAAIADARDFGINDPVAARVTAYNGAERNGSPTLIIQGVATIGGGEVVTEYDFVQGRGSERFGIVLTTFDPVPGAAADPNGPAITLNKLDLRVGKTINTRVSGRRVRRGFLETPTTCPRSGWAFEQEFTFAAGGSLKAGDVVPCTR